MIEPGVAVAEGGRLWLLALAIGLLYLGAARLTLWVSDPVTVGGGLWPAAGVTLLALMVTPRRAWPAILGAVGVAELSNDLVEGFGLLPSVIWTVTNMLEPLAVVLVLQWLRADRFEDVTSTVRFVAIVLTVPLFGGLLGTLGTMLAGTEGAYLTLAARWGIGDGVGMLTIAPLAVLFRDRRARTLMSRPEAVGIVVACAAMTVAAFWDFGTPVALPLLFLALPPLVWAAVRLYVPGAAVATFVVSQIAFIGTGTGYGVIAATAERTDGAAWLLQLYLLTLTTTALVLGSRSRESSDHLELAEARERLISVVSHELRTPLTPIIGFSELILERQPDLPQDVRDAFVIIKRNGEHLVTVVDDLLTVTRSRRGLVTAEPRATGLSQLIGEVLDDLDLAATVPAPTTDAAVWVDPEQLKQILTNLLTNAQRHGRPPFAIDVRETTAHATVVVTDAGDGVPVAFEPHLFQEFSQAAGGDRRTTPGLGLGLAITRSLITANQGVIAYERGTPTGARFLVTLPRSPASASAGTSDGAHLG